MPNAIPADLFEGELDEVIRRLDALIASSKTQEAAILMVGAKIGFLAGIKMR